MKIAVLGGGHGGYAAAADLTLRGYEVCLFTFSAARVETLHNNDNVISYTGVWGEGSCRVAHVSNSMEEAVSGADLVVMNVPGTGHERYLNAMKPYLRGNTVLYMNPGHTGGALRAAHILGRGRIAEANTLSYIARKTSETSVHISSSDKPVTVGVFPAKDTEAVLEVIRKAYPYVVAGRDVLESSLCNINAMFHPPGVVLNAGWIEHTGGDFRFYYDGVTPAIGKVIRMVDEERLAVAKAYGLALDNFCTVLYNAGSTTKEAAEANDPYKACQESEANKFIKAPPSLDHRYMHEDIGSGLLPIAELGRLAGVPTPITDAHVSLSEAMMGRDYHAEGVNLEKMGLEGKTIEQVLDYVTRG